MRDDIEGKVTDRRTISIGESAECGCAPRRVPREGAGETETSARSPSCAAQAADLAPGCQRSGAKDPARLPFLRSRLEIEVNAAIQRGDREIADGVVLLPRK